MKIEYNSGEGSRGGAIIYSREEACTEDQKNVLKEEMHPVAVFAAELWSNMFQINYFETKGDVEMGEEDSDSESSSDGSSSSGDSEEPYWHIDRTLNIKVILDINDVANPPPDMTSTCFTPEFIRQATNKAVAGILQHGNAISLDALFGSTRLMITEKKFISQKLITLVGFNTDLKTDYCEIEEKIPKLVDAVPLDDTTEHAMTEEFTGESMRKVMQQYQFPAVVTFVITREIARGQYTKANIDQITMIMGQLLHSVGFKLAEVANVTLAIVKKQPKPNKRAQRERGCLLM